MWRSCSELTTGRNFTHRNVEVVSHEPEHREDGEASEDAGDAVQTAQSQTIPVTEQEDKPAPFSGGKGEWILHLRREDANL